MNSRTRFHLTAIAAIFLTIYVVQMLNKQPVQQPVEQAPVISARFIMVYEASWGLNCNQFIEQTLQARKAVASKYASDETPEYTDGQPDELIMQEPNNALLKVSELCNTKEQCEFKATSVLLGEPFRNCNKELKIAYRCFEFDRLHYFETYEGQNVSIQCEQ